MARRGWGPYRMTPARMAAIRKAQAASARKRKGSGKAKSSGPKRYKKGTVTKLRGKKAGTFKKKRKLSKNQKRAVAAVATAAAVYGAHKYKKSGTAKKHADRAKLAMVKKKSGRKALAKYSKNKKKLKRNVNSAKSRVSSSRAGRRKIGRAHV